MGTTKNVTISGDENIKIIDAEHPEQETTTKPTAKKIRSKKYVSKNSQVDKTIKYELNKAVEMVKKLSYTKFDGTVEAHLIVKEAGISANVSFPHSTGKSVRAVIFSESLIEELTNGVINFDVLIATAADMPKLTKFAKLLGPKGLMPNPKSGTLTSNPEGKKKELEAGKVSLKTEKKAPLMHVGVGKVSMETAKLAENVQALLDALQGKVVKLTLSATMSPSVKVIIEK